MKEKYYKKGYVQRAYAETEKFAKSVSVPRGKARKTREFPSQPLPLRSTPLPKGNEDVFYGNVVDVKKNKLLQGLF